MTEAEWLNSNDVEEMYFTVAEPASSHRGRDLFCAACFEVVRHLIQESDVKAAFDWLAEHPGHRERSEGRGHVQNLFSGPAKALYEVHHQRKPDIGGAAVHVAYDLWADWYEYAFPNLRQLNEGYPGVLRVDPATYLPAVARDIFGNPFRPVAFDPAWRSSTAVALATGIYADRAFDRLPILADALQDAGCEDADLLGHLRGNGPHVKGCWALDLVLGKE